MFFLFFTDDGPLAADEEDELPSFGRINPNPRSFSHFNTEPKSFTLGGGRSAAPVLIGIVNKKFFHLQLLF